MSTGLTRRGVLGVMAAGALGAKSLASGRGAGVPRREDRPLISLAQWSLHRELFAGSLDHLDFPRVARDEFDIHGVEYVSTFFKDRVREASYLAEMNARCADLGVRQLLVMVDGEGALGDADEAARAKAVENHQKWLDAARTLGCHSIRVNAQSAGTYEEQQTLAADGLRRVCERAEPLGLNVLVENHGGLSSNGAWLAGVMRLVDHPRIGTLPDFGNFCLDWSRSGEADAWYDRYQGTRELMPFARAVSAKSHEFNDEGEEVRTDYLRMLTIVRAAGYAGHIGVEYEGSDRPEREGVRLTKALIERHWARAGA